MARTIDPVCKMCRREGIKLYLKGSALRQPQVRHRTPQRRSGHARLPPRQAERIRHPPAREAEAETLLRPLRTAVPPLLRAGLALAGKHRRGAADASWSAGWTTSCIGWASRRAGPPPASWCCTATSRVNGQHVQHPQHAAARRGDTVATVKKPAAAARLQAGSQAPAIADLQDNPPPLPDFLERIAPSRRRAGDPPARRAATSIRASQTTSASNSSSKFCSR